MSTPATALTHTHQILKSAPRLSAVKHWGRNAVARAARPLRYLSIRNKVLLLPALALLIFVFYCLYTVAQARVTTNNLNEFSTRALPVMTQLATINVGLADLQGSFAQALGEKDEFELEDAQKDAAHLRESLAAIAKTDPRYVARVADLLKLWDDYVAASTSAVKGQISGSNDLQLLQQISKAKMSAFEAIHKGLQGFSAEGSSTFVTAIATARQHNAAALTVGLGIALFAALMLVAGTVLVDQAIRQPIERLHRAISEVAQGDFSIRVDSDGSDAIATMCRAFNALLADLNAAIGETNSVLGAVARGDFTARITASLRGDLAQLKVGVNAGADSVQRTMLALDTVMDALVAGNFGARMSEDVAGAARTKVDTAMQLLQAALADLGKGLDAAAAGDFSSRIQGKLPGALGQLQRSFNLSLESLQTAIGEISATTNALSNGDLTRRANGSFSGSLRDVTEALNTAVESLAEALTEVATAADDVSGGAEEIARGNSDMSQRTEQQASALEKSASAIDELLSSAVAATENSRQTSEITRKALVTARAGADVAAQAGASMQAITISSRSIGEIVGVIDSVAFQTSLLSLNAAVEAARAGEHGRGFAVVATEVRNLSKSTGNSARQIRTLIADEIECVSKGNVLIAESGRQLAEITRSSDNIATLAKDAADSIAEQTRGLQQISESIGQLENVNQQNAALVEEVAASSQSLNERASQLRQIVARFRLSGAAA